MPWPVHSEDHTGAKVRLRRLAFDAFRRSIPPPAGPRIRAETIRKWIPVVGVFAGVLLTLLLVLAAIIAQHGLIFIGLFVHGPIIATAISFALVAAQLAWWLRKRYAAWIETRSLGIAECPACTYGLAGVAADAYGLVACPECNALWRAGDIGKNPASPREIIVIESHERTAAHHAADRPAAERVCELPLV